MLENRELSVLVLMLGRQNKKSTSDSPGRKGVKVGVRNSAEMEHINVGTPAIFVSGQLKANSSFPAV